MERLDGNVNILGGEGEDTINIVELHTRTDSFDVDGEGGTDHYNVVTTNLDTDGSRTDYVLSIHDSGATGDGVDTLVIEGRGAPADMDADLGDVFLIRDNFIARLHGDFANNAYNDEVERINYDESINGRVTINGSLGDDVFVLDDNSAIMTLDGGAGIDFHTVALHEFVQQGSPLAIRDCWEVCGVGETPVFQRLDRPAGRSPQRRDLHESSSRRDTRVASAQATAAGRRGTARRRRRSRPRRMSFRGTEGRGVTAAWPATLDHSK